MVSVGSSSENQGPGDSLDPNYPQELGPCLLNCPLAPGARAPWAKLLGRFFFSFLFFLFLFVSLLFFSFLYFSCLLFFSFFFLSFLFFLSSCFFLCVFSLNSIYYAVIFGALLSRCRTKTRPLKRRKNLEMRKLHIVFKRPTVKRTILKLFSFSVLRSWQRVLFTRVFLFFMDVVFPTTPSTQLLFAVAFVQALGQKKEKKKKKRKREEEKKRKRRREEAKRPQNHKSFVRIVAESFAQGGGGNHLGETFWTNYVNSLGN